MSLTSLTLGYVPLIDAAPLIIADELGFAAEEGLDLTLVRQPTWSALRDMLALGHLDAAHMLSPMPIAMRLGLGGLHADIDVLSVLSINGTVFGISRALAARLGPLPFGAPDTLAEALAKQNLPQIRIGVPFHASMHSLLLKYWLRRRADVPAEIITVPPPRMSDAVSDGQIDAFWVGEPWGSVAVRRGVAQLMMTGRDVWAFAPEKVLAARSDWTEENPDLVRRLMRATYHAGLWLDRARNVPLAVEVIARSGHSDWNPEMVDPALSGELVPVQGAKAETIQNFLRFHRHAAQFPWRSQASWIASQLGADVDGVAKAQRCFRSDLYRANLGPIGADLPGASEKVEGAMAHRTAVASSRGHMILGPDAFFDGATFDTGAA